MKANRSFRRGDEAVSPVIAVILMVAITVVLAATVYVWVSGFGSQSSQPAKSLSLTSAAALSSNIKTYTIASATAGMRWADISVTVDGVDYGLNGGGESCTATGWTDTTAYQVCSGGSTEASTATVNAGDTVRVYSVDAGDTLRILDSQANSVILTLTIG